MIHVLNRFLFVTVAIGFLSFPAFAQITPDQWRQDIDTLAENLLEKHPNFFTTHTVEEFEGAVESLDSKLGSLTDAQIVMEINRLIAKGGDSHTSAEFSAFAKTMNRLPIQVIILSDGVFISGATAPYQELVGKQILKFGDAEADAAFEQISVLFGYENNSRLINAGSSCITLMPALEAVGLAEQWDADTFQITVQNEEGPRTVSLKCEPPEIPQQWVSFAQSFKNGMPLMYRKSSGNYQTEFLSESKTMYMAYNKCEDAKDFPMKLLITFLTEKSEEFDAQRMVIDLRFNGGGNETVLWPFIDALKASQRFSDPGDIIALTSRYTYSSAASNAHQLRDRAGAILIGEPTGGKPNHFGEIKSFQLPNSKLTIYHSTKWFQKVEGDPDAVHPSVLIEVGSEDFFAGSDPVLDAALSYQPD